MNSFLFFMNIFKTLIITAFISLSLPSLAANKADSPYPVPDNLNNWEGNYNPTSVKDYREYYKFLAIKYNSTRSLSQRRSIVKEQNRARNYSASNYDRKIIIQKVSSNGDNINNEIKKD